MESKSTFHGNGLVEGDLLGWQSHLLQLRSSIDIQLKLLRTQNRHAEIGNRLGIIEGKCRIDRDGYAIFGLDAWDRNCRDGRCCAYKRDRGVESIDGWMIYRFVAQDLRLVDMDGVRRWVAKLQACDVEGCIVDVVLRDAWVANIYPDDRVNPSTRFGKRWGGLGWTSKG